MKEVQIYGYSKKLEAHINDVPFDMRHIFNGKRIISYMFSQMANN